MQSLLADLTSFRMMHPEHKHEDETADGLITHAQLLNALNHEAHVYLAFPDRHPNPESFSRYEELLSEGELERNKSFHFARDSNLYVLTHALVRTTLSRYLEIAPGKWAFTCGPHGRPEVAHSEGHPQLRFSVSRTQGLAACMIVLSIDVGVDVEKIRKLDELNTLSEKVLTHHEISRLRDLPESEKIKGFFTLWTLKEAYIKAKGVGLSLPLNRFSFCFDAAGRIRISVDADLQDVPANWQFACYRPTPAHALGVALRRKERTDLRIRFFEATPHRKGLSFHHLNRCALENLTGLTPK